MLVLVVVEGKERGRNLLVKTYFESGMNIALCEGKRREICSRFTYPSLSHPTIP